MNILNKHGKLNMTNRDTHHTPEPYTGAPEGLAISALHVACFNFAVAITTIVSII